MDASQDDRLVELREELPELDLIGDAGLRDKVAEVWLEAWARSEWRHLRDVPKSPSLPRSRTLVRHTSGVARIAAHVADVVTDTHGLPANRDRAVAIALLHDVSKLNEFTLDTDGAPAKSRLGRRYQHGVFGAFLMWQAGLDEDLVHAVVCHTPESATVPQTLEAVIVHYADFVDTDVQLLDAGRELFCKRGRR